MPSRVTFPDSFLARIKNLQRASQDAGEVMPELERLAWQDNADGLMASTDKDGRPLAPLAQSTLKNRHRGPGGPLVPNGRQSRFIKNYRDTSFRRSDGNWVIVGTWMNVLSKRGVPITPFHVEGRGRNPVRDIAGVRPTGRKNIAAAFRAYLMRKWSQ